MKGQKFLKVTSILMIIGGVLAAITGLLALLGISALAAMAGSAEGTGLLYASSALAIVSSIIELIAGIKGVGACSAPQKAGSCVKWGIIIVALSIGHWPDCRRKLQLYKPGLESDCARPVYLRCNTDEKRITVQTARGSVDGSLWQELYSKDGN